MLQGLTCVHLCDAVQGERHASTRRHELSTIRLQLPVRAITKFLSPNNITVNNLSLLCDERVGHASDDGQDVGGPPAHTCYRGPAADR